MSNWACIYVILYAVRLRRVVAHRARSRRFRRLLAQASLHFGPGNSPPYHRILYGVTPITYGELWGEHQRLIASRPAGYFRSQTESECTDTDFDDGHFRDFSSHQRRPELEDEQWTDY